MSREVVILFSNNKTAKWLLSKTAEEKEELFHKARRAIKLQKLYREQKQILQEERAQIWKSKQAAPLRLQEKALKEKETLTNELMLYGLWQCESDISQGLAKLQSKLSNLKALKVQLAFPK